MSIATAPNTFNPAKPSAAAEPSDMKSILKLGELLPPNFGDSNANEIAQTNLQKLTGKGLLPTGEKPAAMSPDPKNPAPAAPSSPDPLDKNPADIKETPKAPAPKPVEPAGKIVEPEPAIPDADEALLEALDGGKKVVEPKKESPAEALLDGKEVVPELEVETFTENTLPKSAKDQRSALIQMSKKLREQGKQLKELQTKGNVDIAVQATEPLKAEIEQLKLERADLLNKAAAGDVTHLPWVQQKIVQPMRVASDFITTTLQENDGVDRRAIQNALSEKDLKKRHAIVREACVDLHQNDGSLMEQAVDAMFQLNGELDQVRSNASQISQAEQKRQTEQNAAQRAQYRSEALKAHKTTFDAMLDDPVLSRFAADPEIKKQFDTVQDLAQKADADMSWAQDHALRAKALQQALAYPVLKKAYEAKMKENLLTIKKLTAENLKLKGPGLSTSPRSAYVPNNPEKAPQGVEGIVKGAFKGML